VPWRWLGWDGAGTDSNDEKILDGVVEIHGNPWKSMEIHGNPWKSMEIHGNPLKSMEIHGNPI